MTRWLYRRGKIWHYRFKVGGREFTGSTEATDLETAKTVLEIVRRDCVLGEHGIRKAPTLKAVAQGWIDTAGKGKSPGHRRAAVLSLEALHEMHRLPLTHITQARYDAWRADYLEEHSEASANHVARYLKLWLRWALADKLIKEMPCTIKQPRPQEIEKPIVELDEVDVVMAAIRKGHRNPQVPAAVAFAMMLGLRESEVLGARWEAIQGTTYTVSGKSTAKGRTKSKRNRVITIPEELRVEMMWMLAAQQRGPAQVPKLGLIFPGTRGKVHTQGWLRQALKRSGIEGLSMHRLRATFITLHLRRGTSLKATQKMAGHADPRTTLGYQKDSLDEQAESQNSLWKRA